MTVMGWFITADAGEFLAEAAEFLRAEPVRNTVMLTVTENLRVKPAAPSPAAAPATAPATAQPRPSPGLSHGRGLSCGTRLRPG